MRLELFSVRDFRSISNADKLPLGEFTVLLGPNNEGKSNILQAMAIGMQELAAVRVRGRRASPSIRSPRDERTSGGYVWERDFPQHLQPADPSGKTVMHFDFSLSDEEVNDFHAAVGSRLNGVLPITLNFSRDSIPEFRVRKQRHAAALTAKRPEIAAFLAERVQVQYVNAVRTGDNATEIVSQMLRRELRAAATNMPDLAEALAKVREIQKPIFDTLSQAITENLKELLPDVTDVTIRPGDDGVMSPYAIGRGISVLVDDGTSTDLKLKGDGVQSLAALAMTQHYGRETARAREFILAIEEPEAHLHPRAVHGLRETLRETANSQQVIITTHSPLFANRLDLASNIIVRRNRAAPAQSVEELREALGVRAADNLSTAEVVLVVEGPADEVALRALLASRSASLSRAITDGLLSIKALHGGGKLNYLLTQIRDSLTSVHAFLDGDEAGKQAGAAAMEEGLLGRPDITFANCLGASESEFEDLVDPALYSNAFQQEFGLSIEHPWLNSLGKGKWSRRMALIFQSKGASWDDDSANLAKTLIARAIAERPSSAVKDSCDGVFESLTTALELKLKLRLQ